MNNSSVSTRPTTPFSARCTCRPKILGGASFIGLKGGVMFKLDYCRSCMPSGGTMPRAANDEKS